MEANVAKSNKKKRPLAVKVEVKDGQVIGIRHRPLSGDWSARVDLIFNLVKSNARRLRLRDGAVVEVDEVTGTVLIPANSKKPRK